tara:strand:+ start:2411 stop:5428 length:3018 start_codon:yes stop_codon:yes gene_type:complete
MNGNAATPSSSRLTMLLCIFVLSGFAGLIYQSIWSHYLGLFLGHAAYAQALVLAIFMGGMAAGAAWVSHAGGQCKNLIRRYALIEAVIGALALLFHWFFVGMMGLSYDVIIPALGSSAAIELYKWILAALLIMPQTILLGMTFPLMSGGIIRRFPGSDGHVLGGLYFSNSIGAAVGVLFSAFIIVPWVGLMGAMLAAGLMNFVVAGLAWLMCREDETVPPRFVQSSGEESKRSKTLLRVVLIATFFSGAASFAYEIIWIRMLSLAVGTTLHAFELMLASFIAGIAFGGLWVRSRADKSGDPIKLVGWLQVLMGLTALSSLYFYSNSFAWVGYLMSSLSQSDGAYTLFNLGTGMIAILIMLPAAFFAGTTLPLFTVILLRSKHGEPSIGRVYAWNTLGAILGVFTAIHLLIPVLGLKLALISAAMVDIFIGLLLLRYRAFENRDMIRIGICAVAVLVCVGLSVFKIPFDPLRLSSGVYRSGVAALPENTQVPFYRDGKTASVASSFSNTGAATISTNGKPDASIQMNDTAEPTVDEPTMVLLGALPLAYLESLRTAAVIGFGSGLSTHTLLADQQLKRVDTIEIERAMIDGAQIFGHRVERAYNDPRSNIVINDAKSFFSGRQHKYDLIISEPSNPWISGVGALFSKEFYEFVPKFMTEDGVFLQWLQLYEIDEALVGTVLNALTPVFKDYHAYMSNNADLLIVASMRDLPNEVDFAKLFDGRIATDLQRVGFDNPEQIAFRRVADARMLLALANMYSGRVNSDYFPVLSLEAPKARFQKKAARHIAGIQIASLPVLEFLSISNYLTHSVSTGVRQHYSRSDKTEQARSARAILLGLEDGIHPAYLNSAEITLEIAAISRCAPNEERSNIREDLFVKGLKVLADTVLPYLSPMEQRGVFIDPLWTDCGRYSEFDNQLLAFLEAAASRDIEGVIERGEAWFDPSVGRSKVYSDEFDPLIYGYLQLAYIAAGEEGKAFELEERLGHNVPLKGDTAFIRSLLLAWLDLG